MTATEFQLEVTEPFLLAGAPGAIWLAAGSTVRRLDPLSGDELASGRIAAAAVDLAATAETVFVALGDGTLVGLDGGSLEPRFSTFAATEAVRLAAGRDSVWTAESERGLLRRFDPEGSPAAALETAPVDRLAVGTHGVWYTSRDDTLLHFTEGTPDSYRSTDAGVPREQRGGITCCANAVWLSARGHLFWVAQHDLRIGRPFAVAGGPVTNLICADGRVVGGDRLEEMFVLDPAADADVQRLESGGTGEIAALAAAGSVVWAVGREDLRVRVIRF